MSKINKVLKNNVRPVSEANKHLMDDILRINSSELQIGIVKEKAKEQQTMQQYHTFTHSQKIPESKQRKTQKCHSFLATGIQVEQVDIQNKQYKRPLIENTNSQTLQSKSQGSCYPHKQPKLLQQYTSNNKMQSNFVKIIEKTKDLPSHSLHKKKKTEPIQKVQKVLNAQLGSAKRIQVLPPKSQPVQFDNDHKGFVEESKIEDQRMYAVPITFTQGNQSKTKSTQNMQKALDSQLGSVQQIKVLASSPWPNQFSNHQDVSLEGLAEDDFEHLLSKVGYNPENKKETKASSESQQMKTAGIKLLSSKTLLQQPDARHQASVQGETKEFKYIVTILENLLERVKAMESQHRENNKLLQQLIKKKSKVSEVPKCFPFRSVENLIDFETVDDNVYDEVVSYLIYLGGHNSTDSLAIYLKEALVLEENLLGNISCYGASKNKKLGLCKTRFARACQEALHSNSTGLKPDQTEINWAMGKALKSMKERLRRKICNVAEGDNGAVPDEDLEDNEEYNQQNEYEDDEDDAGSTVIITEQDSSDRDIE